MDNPTTNQTSAELKLPLSGLQLELLKLYSTDLSEAELLDLKRELAQYFAKKAITAADQTWEDRQLSNEDMDAWLHE